MGRREKTLLRLKDGCPGCASGRGKAVVRAKKGAAYQVVIDGKRIVDVKSQGTDALPLE